jgi:hypothetical protein
MRKLTWSNRVDVAVRAAADPLFQAWNKQMGHFKSLGTSDTSNSIGFVNQPHRFLRVQTMRIHVGSTRILKDPSSPHPPRRVIEPRQDAEIKKPLGII